MKRASFLLAGVTLAAAAMAAPRTATAQPPPDPVSSCTSYDLLLLMDRSLSLGDTDPSFRRVDAAEELVDGLSGVASEQLPITISVAGFGTTVDPPSRFALPSQRDDAHAALDNFRQAPRDHNTDYVLALEAARDHFAGADPATCKQLMWFTDGAYDIDDVPATRSYTTLPDEDAIIADLENQVCNGSPYRPAPADPLGPQLRQTNVEVIMVDLRSADDTQDQKDLRAKTDPVLNRLFNLEDPCGVRGERIPVANTAALIDVFRQAAERILASWRADFDQQQAAAGRIPVNYATLQQGMPVNVVSSIGARGDSPSTPVTVHTPSGDISSFTHDFTDPERQTGGLVTVHGATACFAATNGNVELVGDPQVWSAATTTHLAVTVGGTGSDGRQLPGLSGDEATVAWQAGTANGAATWNPDLRRWEFDVPQSAITGAGPVELNVDATITSLNTPLTALSESLPVVSDPSPPTVTWVGASSLEGTGEVQGTLRVSPAASIGGQVCVSFPAPSSPLRDAGGTELGRLNVAVNGDTCKPDTAAFDIPAAVTVEQSANTTAVAELIYEARYEAVDVAHTETSGSTEVSLELAKPADTRTMVWTALILALASGALSAAALWLATRYQSRLPDPDGFLMAAVPLTSVADGSVVPVDVRGVEMADLRRVDGSRSRFRLSPETSIRRRATRNPFASISAHVVTDRGVVTADPSLGRRDARRQEVSNRFRRLFVVRRSESGEDAEGLLVVPRGTTPNQATALIAESLARINRTATIPARPSSIVDHNAGPTAPTLNDHDPADQSARITTTPRRRTPPPPPPRRPR